MSTNTEVLKRFVKEVVNQGRMDTIDEVLHQGYRYHGPGGVQADGPDGARRIIGEFRAAFSDLHAEIRSEAAEGEQVSLTMMVTGTHDGELMGMAPTGSRIELPMAIVSRFEDGLIVEEWEEYDTDALMSQLTNASTTLVIGAGGKTGRRVTDRLIATGRRVRPASRSGETRFDWEDDTTWAPALAGVNAAYITYYPDLALPGAADIVGSFADLAVASGVRRLVLLSGRGEEGARQAEVRVQSSGADWTIVRCAFFNQNFSETFVDAVRYGTLAMPGGDTAEPFLDADDIADVVVAALTDDRHIGQLYELTGPRLLTLSQAAAELGSAMGREVRYVPLTAEKYASELVTHGLPEEEAVPISQLIEEVLDGRNEHLSDGVQRALGRPPRDFGDYARDTAATGVWNLEEQVQ